MLPSTINLPFSVSYECSFLFFGNRDSHFLNPKKPLVLKPHVRFCSLHLERKQPSPEELGPHEKLEFSDFTAREAFLEEEYWMAASLKWKNKSGFITFGKRVDTIQEEYDWNKKWWREPRPGHFHACIIAVKKHSKDVTRTVRGSVQGTLDLDITCLDHPGVKRRPPGFYINKIPSTGYIGSISNVCVAYSYRHKDIASNMLCFAIEYSKSRGVKNLYVEVQENNGPALALFQKFLNNEFCTVLHRIHATVCSLLYRYLLKLKTPDLRYCVEIASLA